MSKQPDYEGLLMLGKLNLERARRDIRDALFIIDHLRGGGEVDDDLEWVIESLRVGLPETP